jgi:hypothetical protein
MDWGLCISISLILAFILFLFKLYYDNSNKDILVSNPHVSNRNQNLVPENQLHPFHYAGPPIVAPDFKKEKYDQRIFLKGPLFVDRCIRSHKTSERDRMMVVSYSISSDMTFSFKLVGASGNVYQVSIGSTLECDCPDKSIHKSGDFYDFNGIKHCKHLFFLKQKVFKIPLDHEMLCRLGYRRWEREYMKLHANFGAEMAPPSIRELLSSNQIHTGTPKTDETCAICCESLQNETNVYCEVSCRSGLHQSCFETMKLHTPELKCPTCRMPWVENVVKNTQKITVMGKEYVSIKHLRPKPPKRRSLSTKQ